MTEEKPIRYYDVEKLEVSRNLCDLHIKVCDNCRRMNNDGMF